MPGVGVPIGSVYRFFPTRTALIARLFAEEMVEIDNRLADALAETERLETVGASITALLNDALALVLDRPWLKSVLNAPAIDEPIALADRENTKTNADRLARALVLLKPDAHLDEISATALLVCHLWAPTVQLCLAEPEKADQIAASYGAMITAHLRALG